MEATQIKFQNFRFLVPQSITPRRNATIALKVHAALLKFIAMCIVVS